MVQAKGSSLYATTEFLHKLFQIAYIFHWRVFTKGNKLATSIKVLSDVIKRNTRSLGEMGTTTQLGHVRAFDDAWRGRGRWKMVDEVLTRDWHPGVARQVGQGLRRGGLLRAGAEGVSRSSRGGGRSGCLVVELRCRRHGGRGCRHRSTGRAPVLVVAQVVDHRVRGRVAARFVRVGSCGRQRSGREAAHHGAPAELLVVRNVGIHARWLRGGTRPRSRWRASQLQSPREQVSVQRLLVLGEHAIDDELGAHDSGAARAMPREHDVGTAERGETRRRAGTREHLGNVTCWARIACVRRASCVVQRASRYPRGLLMTRSGSSRRHSAPPPRAPFPAPAASQRWRPYRGEAERARRQYSFFKRPTFPRYRKTGH